MKTVMIGDRLFDRVYESKMIVLDDTMRLKSEQRTENWDKHIKTAYEAGKML